MQIDLVRLFCDVATHRSVSRAAELHGVTQSAVSQRIMGLERELGVQLIDRSKRPLQLTAAGEIYHHGCRQILDQYEQLTRRVAGTQSELTGTVRVAAIYSAGIDLLNRAVEAFGDDHPRARVEVQYHQPDTVYQRVRSDQVDLGILSYPDRWRDVAYRSLRDEVMAVVCRADHELAGRESLAPADLADQALVLFDPSLPISRRITSYLREHGLAAQAEHTFDNIDTIKAYLAQSREVGILPERTVRREVAEGSLAAVALRPQLKRPIAIVHNRQRRLTPAVEAFIQTLVTTSNSIAEAEAQTRPDSAAALTA